MITAEVFEKLRESPTNSWAVWDVKDDNNLAFFRANLTNLHGKVIFVGLNRSDVANDSSKVFPLSNFHTRDHIGDKRLKRFIQDNNLSNLIGGFMTDISEQIESNSKKVKIQEQDAVKKFAEKVRSIDDSQKRHIICFGNDVFDCFIKPLRISKNLIKEIPENKIKYVEVKGNYETWHLYRVWHYSNFREPHKPERELPIQLRYINDKIEPD